MPRLSRKTIQSSYVHVITQGANGDFIFKRDYYKEKYLNILKKYKNENKISILTYCVMDNHVHLMLWGNEINDISKFMHNVNLAYAKYYNYKEDRTGFVFNNRFFCKAIKNEKQLLDCFVYIHKNPVKARMVKEEKMYKYSGYNEYLGKEYLIDSVSKELVFGTSKFEKYKEQFLYIHTRKIKEIFEEKKNIDLEDLISELRNDKLNQTEIVKLLKTEYKFSERKIAKYMNIKRCEVRKIVAT